MADGQQIWNFPGITASADGIRKATTMVAAEESQIKGNLTTLASIWGGASSDTYQALQLRWNTKSEAVNQALTNLANAIDQAAMDMASTESKVGARFV
ncbi:MULTISPECIES: WXG100 family type VII secretion target [Mycolicibacterium]|uniref:ESAT-6-like protein n=1 Tax=Mycolicibacterium fortuitum TaxID=1766 RepID=A0AAE4VF99_MYCFO|nr:MULTISPECIES: WXG100 family type VII secretion target [Mycolicibacterium]MBU8814043.1 WXG100 family type VII secretion target [Mycolicibacterium goodii]MDV7193279.1 WXG100 family type VII secretion target [Mycolicibacterium fortuitum]MDV7206041.1 WXG100 family type VII secretion target [Mycolicibacterium fortuitum]MDV7227453.1 WXG100 family type VII secretion target [Mycolicibacterium fortuitum]MDV7259849.1 WXG100 family type VII secretion target [Mycolicibacterium fortuitum]